MNKEYYLLSKHNHIKAVEYFKSTGDWFEGCVLHHIDDTLRHNNIERYIQWNPEDLVVMGKSEHSRLHHIGKLASDETKAKMSKSRKGRSSWNKGIPMSEDVRKKVSDTMKGRPAKNRKKVECVETKQVFESASAAALNTGVTVGAIGYAIRNKTMCRGYHWEYIEEE